MLSKIVKPVEVNPETVSKIEFKTILLKFVQENTAYFHGKSYAGRENANMEKIVDIIIDKIPTDLMDMILNISHLQDLLYLIFTSLTKSTVTLRIFPIFLCSFIFAEFTPMNVISAACPLSSLCLSASLN